MLLDVTIQKFFSSKGRQKKKRKRKKTGIHKGFHEESEFLTQELLIQEGETLCDQGPFKELEPWYDKTTFEILATPKDLRFIEMSRYGGIKDKKIKKYSPKKTQCCTRRKEC